MNALIINQNNLPKMIEDLSKFVLIGREQLNAVRAEIRAIDKLNIASEVRDQKKNEARMMSEALMDAEVRLGELFKQIPKTTAGTGSNQYKKSTAAESNTTVNNQKFKKDTAAEFEKSAEIDSAVDFSKLHTNGKSPAVSVSQKSKKEVIEELGFSQKQAERFEIMADNKDIVEQVKAEAGENDDIPTRTRVLDMVAFKKRQEEDYYKKVDLRVSVYKQLSSIIEKIRDFEVTSERINALLDAYTGNITIEGQIQEIDECAEILKNIKFELLKGKKYAKRS